MVDVPEHGVQPLRAGVGFSQSLFRTVVQSSWDVLQLVSPTGEILYESPAVTRILGYLPEEMVGRNALEFVHPEDLERVMQGPQELSRPGDQRCIALRVRHKNGTWRWVESHEINLTDDPDVGAIAVNYRDITERKLAEEALHESHRALRLVSRCNAALIRSENESELLSSICRIAIETGDYSMAWVGFAEQDAASSISVQACAGQVWEYLEGIPMSWDANSPTGRMPAANTIRSGQPVVIADVEQEESFGFFRDVARRFGVRGLICLPLKDHAVTFGVVILYLPVFRPMAENDLPLLKDMADNVAHGILSLRMREQSHLAQQKIAQQAALLDEATNAIFVRDLDHNVTYWNKSAERLYEWTSEEVLGRSARELLHASVDASLWEEAHARLFSEGHWAGELRKRSKGGKEITVEARWTLLRDGQGEPQAVLTINNDITERKKLEAQFLRAQRMESIGTLAGGIAHDLNNVLAPIVLSLELLKLSSSEPEARELISVLEASARHGAGMVSQLLSFSRGVEGVRMDIKIGNLIKDAEKIAVDTFFKSIKVRTVVPEDLWSITGDSTQLHQVLLNLCVNARDAMPHGGQLTLSAENVWLDAHYAALNIEAKPGPYVAIEVQDDGTGIAPELMEKIFDPFFTTKELGKGTGLGLSTLLGIVQSHGGFVRVYSELRKGTKFKVYLPANTVPAAAATQVQAVDMPRGKGETILVVDDEPSVRQVTKETLEAFGYGVVLASNGAEAVATYASRKDEIRAVITDMTMPIMGGLATINVLQRLNPELPIIAASGLEANGDMARASTMGIREFLCKPYTADKMLKALQRALSPAS